MEVYKISFIQTADYFRMNCPCSQQPLFWKCVFFFLHKMTSVNSNGGFCKLSDEKNIYRERGFEHYLSITLNTVLIPKPIISLWVFHFGSSKAYTQWLHSFVLYCLILFRVAVGGGRGTGLRTPCMVWTGMPKAPKHTRGEQDKSI